MAGSGARGRLESQIALDGEVLGYGWGSCGGVVAAGEGGYEDLLGFARLVSIVTNHPRPRKPGGERKKSIKKKGDKNLQQSPQPLAPPSQTSQDSLHTP